MGDEKLRELERAFRARPDDAEAEARWLRERLRRGDLAPERLAAARALGHAPAALALALAEAPRADEAPGWLDAVLAVGREAWVRAAVAACRARLRPWRNRFEGPDDRLVLALEGVEALVREAGAPRAIEAVAAARALLDEAASEGAFGPTHTLYGLGNLALAVAATREDAQDVVSSALGAVDVEPAREALRDDLVPWLLGTGDPLLERSARHGTLLGLEPDIVRSVAFSPDGALAASTGRAGRTTVWDVASARAIVSLPKSSREIHSVAFSPDGRRLLLGDDGGEASLWEWDGPRKLRAFEHPDGRVDEVLFLPGGARALTAGFDGAVRLWDLESGKELAALAEGRRTLTIALSIDGRTLVVGAGDATIRVVDLEAAREVRRASLPDESAVTSLALAPDASLVAAANWRIHLVDPRTGAVRTIDGHERTTYGVAFLPGGDRLVSAAGDATVRTWEVATGEELGRSAGLTGLPLCLALSPDGRTALVGQRGGGVRSFAPGALPPPRRVP